MAFSRLGLDACLVQKVATMGYTQPTPIQEAAIPEALAGRDVIGCAQTGTGKTAAFILPILQRISNKRGVKALIITPTRELASQIEEVAVTCGRATRHRTVAIYGGVSYRPQESKLRAGVDLVVATPGRLLDLMESRTVNLSGVEMLVLDEADRMLDMGFWPDVKRIISALPRERQTLLFSATMSPKTLNVISSTLSEPVTINIGRPSTPVKLINQIVYPVGATEKNNLLLEILKQQEMLRVLIFARTKRRVDRLCDTLTRNGLAAAPIHSGLTQAQRARTLADFKRGRIRFLVGTDIVARGIDVENITHVVNYDIPTNPEDYVHRIGRTARAGENGAAISLLGVEELSDFRQIESFIDQKLPCEYLESFTYQNKFVLSAAPRRVMPKSRGGFQGRRSGRPFAPAGRR